MRATIALAVTCVLAMASPSEAQLRLTNSNEETIVIKFLPTALRPGKMREEEIPPTQQNDPPSRFNSQVTILSTSRFT